jgi:antitoxin YefM
MKVLSLSEAKIKLGSILGILERTDEPVTITRNGKPIAVILSKMKYEGLQATLEILSNAKFAEEIRDGIRALRRTHGRVTIDELFADEEKR